MAPLAVWDNLHNAGDVNSDGYADLLYYGHPTPSVQWGTFVGIVDGATLQVLWQKHIPDGWIRSPIFPSEIGKWVDLDGDQVVDMVVGYTLWNLQSGLKQGYVAALSGLDGSTIWEHFDSDWGGGSGFFGGDVTGDGVPEIFFSPNTFASYLIDGATGQTIWQLPIADFLPWLPPMPQPWIVHPTFFAVPEMGAACDTLYAVVEGTEAGEVFKTQFLCKVDAASGQVLQVDRFPPDLQPWTSDSVGTIRFPFSQYLGDIDRDGLPELARVVNTPSLDSPNWPGWSASNIIYGQPTLDFPALLPLTGTHTVDIDIPNAPGMSGQLLLSTGFARDTGYAPDHWRTGLVEDSLFAWSQGQGISTTLDASGHGQRSFQLPNKPGLIGQTVYARFLVPDPAKPGSLWTLSSLGSGLVTP